MRSSCPGAPPPRVDAVDLPLALRSFLSLARLAQVRSPGTRKAGAQSRIPSCLSLTQRCNGAPDSGPCLSGLTCNLVWLAAAARFGLLRACHDCHNCCASRILGGDPTTQHAFSLKGSSSHLLSQGPLFLQQSKLALRCAVALRLSS